jgi:hypothetical protein
MENQTQWSYMRKEDEDKLRQKLRRIQELQPLPLRVLPLPWEDLGSLLSRTAREMGYEKPEWLIRLKNVPHKMNPDDLPRLYRKNDYLLLRQLLILEEGAIYALTLHRFARRLGKKVQLLSDLPGEKEQSINRPGLPYDFRRLFFLDGRHTKVCSLCLDEENGYDRLYWRCTLILYCPRHRVLLVHNCPICSKPIPALRLSPTLCPACKTGDYRTDLNPLLPEDDWLEPSHRRLLRYLDIDETEVGASLISSEETTLDRLPSPTYFEILSVCSSLLMLSSLTEERSTRFLLRELPLEAIEVRLLQSLRIFSYEIHVPLLVHYLSSAWPLHVLAFLTCLQRLLQEVFQYAPQSGVVQRWSHSIVEGNFWCSLPYLKHPASLLRRLYRVCEQRFKSLPSADSAEDYHGGEIVNERLLLKRGAEVAPLDSPLLPRDWESLPSVLARAADAMGYRRTEGVWIEPLSGTHRYNFTPDEVLLLKRNDDYHFMQKVLLLDEGTLHSLTLHHFAPRFPSLESSGASPALWSMVARPFLSEETITRHCLPTLTTKVCPACLEQDEYERLYWNMRWVLICPHHHLILINRCPNCHWLIPAIRRTKLSECPYYGTGDYRAAERVTPNQDSLLSVSQRMVLYELGVDVQQSQQVPPLFRNTPLEMLRSWDYFDALYSFGSLFRYLRPERTLIALCRRLGLPDERFLYHGLEDHRTAMQVALFSALFVSWPDQIDATLPGALSHRRFMEQDDGSHLLDGTTEHFSAALKRLVCEALAMYTQQALRRSLIYYEP